MNANFKKILFSLLLVGVASSLAGFGTFSAFSSTTTNSGNSFSAGTVTLGDNDAGGFLYNVSNQKPNVNTEKCILLTYTGSLDADVKLYTTSSINATANNINLTVEKGTSTGAGGFPDCGTFTSEATIYSGNLLDFGTNKNSYANGVAAYPGSATKWVNGNTLVYRFTLSVTDAGAGATSGAHAFTWEARNQ